MMAVIHHIYLWRYTDPSPIVLRDLKIWLNQKRVERENAELAIPVGDPVDVVAVDTGLVANVEQMWKEK